MFQWLQDQGGVADEEMYRTFNCGVGMIVCVPADEKSLTLDTLKAMGETAWQIGVIESHSEPGASPEVRYAPGLVQE